MSAMARRTQQVAVLIVTALVHAAVAENDAAVAAENDAGGHESAGHHGVQGHWTGGFSHILQSNHKFI